MKYIFLHALIFLSRICYCQSVKETTASVSNNDAAESIKGKDILLHTKILASDEFEGRAPGTTGEILTVDYITKIYRQLGLEPGNPDGSFVQQVPLYGYKSSARASIASATKNITLSYPENFVAVSRKQQEKIDVEGSEMVFVGYGVVAPEYGWDDYKGIDVKGKTIVMLVGDPPVAIAQDSGKLDNKYFKGTAMTYYGRWTYKYEIASAKGAAAAIIVHETGAAGYPFEVVTGSWGHENFDIANPNDTSYHVSVESWISTPKAKEIFAVSGQSFDELKKLAATKKFAPVNLSCKANFNISNTLRSVQSKNVLAKINGTDPKLKEEYIVYTAHWDHLGKDESKQGDQIFNGALDNASGVAGLLEIAEAFTKAPPKRTVLFMALTGEEEGLLGAKYYTASPFYPLNKTVANINMDVINPHGITNDLVVIGSGQNQLEDVLKKVLTSRKRVVAPETTPEKGFYYRSDHFEFAKAGIPALYVKIGVNFQGKTKEWGKEQSEKYITTDYHKVSDDVKPEWSFDGGAEDMKALFLVGAELAGSTSFPSWKAGSEFKARREVMTGKTK